MKSSNLKKKVINLRHIMDFGDAEFKVRVVNNGKIATNMRDLVLLAGEYV